MMFVDGENLTCRAQKYFDSGPIKIKLEEGKYFERNHFLWMPFLNQKTWATSDVASDDCVLKDTYALRSYYFTSVQGDEPKRKAVEQRLRDLRFTPFVYPRVKERGSKGVDIALTTEMLSHAYRGNYDIAVLVAADADYLPLIQEVKRQGKLVHLWFLDEPCVTQELKLAVDLFADMRKIFTDRWKKAIEMGTTQTHANH